MLGCGQVNCGIESRSQSSLQNYKSKGDLSHSINSLDILTNDNWMRTRPPFDFSFLEVHKYNGGVHGSVSTYNQESYVPSMQMMSGTWTKEYILLLV